MAEDSYPQPARNAGQVTTLEYQTMASGYGPSGVLTGSAPLVNSQTATIQLPPMTAVLQGTFYSNSSTLSVAVPQNNTDGTTRIDALVVRLTKATGLAAATVVTGTPAANPAPPTLLNSAATFDLPLAYYQVPAGQLPTQVVDCRQLIGANVSASPLAYPPPLPRPGSRWLQTDTSWQQVWTGAGWVQDGGPAPSSGGRFGGVVAGSAASSGIPLVVESGSGLIPGPSTTSPLTVAPGAGGRWRAAARIRFSGGAASGSSAAWLITSADGIPMYLRAVTGGSTVTAYAETEVDLSDGDRLAFAVTLAAGVAISGDNSSESGFTFRRVA